MNNTQEGSQFQTSNNPNNTQENEQMDGTSTIPPKEFNHGLGNGNGKIINLPGKLRSKSQIPNSKNIQENVDNQIEIPYVNLSNDPEAGLGYMKECSKKEKMPEKRKLKNNCRRNSLSSRNVSLNSKKKLLSGSIQKKKKFGGDLNEVSKISDNSK